MKITARNNIIPIQRTAGPAEAERSARPGRGSAAHPDTVKVSSQAQKMQQADARRIADLARAIADGTYQVDMERLADAFVRRELQT